MAYEPQYTRRPPLDGGMGFFALSGIGIPSRDAGTFPVGCGPGPGIFPLAKLPTVPLDVSGGIAVEQARLGGLLTAGEANGG